MDDYGTFGIYSSGYNIITGGLVGGVARGLWGGPITGAIGGGIGLIGGAAKQDEYSKLHDFYARESKSMRETYDDCLGHCKY
jgi:hypothetical protein